MADGIRAERWPDSALLKIFDRGRKRAGAQDKCQIMGTFLAEVSFDQTGIINAAIDHRSGVDAVLQYNGHLAALVLLGERAEAAGSFR